MKPFDIKGQKFGRLIVIKYDDNSKGTGHGYWFCKCDCGKIISARSSHLRDGGIASCGCLAKESARKLLTAYANSDAHKGKGNPQWKGKNASLDSIHQWLRRYFKKEKCEHCKAINKKFDWALKNGCKYRHNRKNFMCLCRSCHMKYDYKSTVRIPYTKNK